MSIPKITHAEFIKSAQGISDSLPEDRSEVVFLGRSNVGKSSTINTLVNRKSLAKSSSTPGKTQLINFFNITYKDEVQEYPLRLVDLPGFGYAKVSKTLKSAWQRNLLEFIQHRVSIRLFVHLRDARHPRAEIDEDVYMNLQKIVRPDQALVTVFTKMDKLNQKERAALKKEFPNAIMFSNLKSHTIDPLHKKILYTIFGIEA